MKFNYTVIVALLSFEKGLTSQDDTFLTFDTTS